MNGYEFLARMTEDVSLARVPAIVLTSAILEPYERSLLQRASMVMSKSGLTSATLIDAIERAATDASRCWSNDRAPRARVWSSMTMMAVDT